jgi:5'-3' exonuclease
MNSRILLVDLAAVLHAIKFSLGKHRLSYKEKDTFVIYGFLLKLNFLLRKTNARVVVFALDSDTSKRRDIYADYKLKRKQNRTEQQIELDTLALPQFEEIKKYVLPTLGYRNVFGAEGFEADDVIGVICKKYKQYQIVLCSTDQDMYQLLTPNVCMLNAKTNAYYTVTDFQEEYGIEPKMWKRVKAIGGCKSDNVQGVPIPQPDPTKKQLHVAEKGALNFIKGEMKPTTKAYQAITSREGKDIINRNKKLVILPFKGTPEYTIRPDRPREIGMRDICEKYGFKSIEDDFEFWKKTLRLK